MPTRDIHHAAVRNALLNDGWLITDDPVILRLDEIKLYADLGAERLLGVGREEDRVVIEVKGLGAPSFIADFERAVGQYLIYRSIMKQVRPGQAIYMAVTVFIYAKYLQLSGAQYLLQDLDSRLLVFDESSEEVLEWIS